ncbi:MAG TPA: PEP-CTERM sorting domain-containing protein [Myxococcota bacterium]|nr:PEP-CTERM sorting domain-containing protein [Myxococcota bacterium]
MTRTLISWMAAAGMTFAAVSASAAIVTLAGPSTALQGSTILITATGSTGVGPADVTGVSVLGSLTYADAFVNTNIPGSSQTPVVAGWTNGVLDCTTARCRAFNQIAPVGTIPFVPVLSNFLISSTSFIIDPATPVGTVLTFNWQTTPTTQGLLFFGATPGAGVTMTVVVPEPTTLAMLGLGLFGLAIAGRRHA